MSIQRKCAWCGADISHRDPRSLTCSRQCKSKRDAVKNPKYIKKPKRACTCKVCASIFFHPNPRARLCSPECKSQERCLASQKAAKKRKAERRLKPLFKECAICNGVFEIIRSRGAVYRATCSDDCFQELKNKRWRKMFYGMSNDQKDNRRASHREWERKSRAQAALAAILLPTRNLPEVNQ